MKTWTKEERYRVLKNKEELRELHDRTVSITTFRALQDC